ncbi:MAG: acetyl-CoA C-acetyltransferase [Vicinamibacteria bacterium]|nr:acetyl-CoA C-acetyltransferase [Vicinamibacteria bacterium]
MMGAVILSACRTAIGSFGGALKDLSAPQLGAIVIREAIARAHVGGDQIDDVLMGCVLQAGAGMNVARQAALGAGLPASVPAETVNRVCGSGLAAVMHAADAIAAGTAEFVVAGGAESMSNAPYLLEGARWGYRMGNAEVVDVMVAEGLTCAIESCHMGTTAEAVAARYGITRAAQDTFAAESQRRAGAAQDAGWFTDEIVVVTLPQKKGDPIVVARDEYPRHGTTAEKLGALKAAFQKDGTVTAGNASGINDGAAALVVADERAASTTGRAPLARILAYATMGVEPMLMGLGPVPAVRKAVARAGLALTDIDLFELNEAFAAQALAVVQDLDVDPARVNIGGGAVALGHPIGASGARVLVTLIHHLRRTGGRYGVASLCVGGGMGVAMVVERD